MLLGIPIPQVFVAQRSDGVWDVVDGLQRLSTIYEFVGILRDENDELVPALVLEKTKYLPSLEGKVWDDPNNPARSLLSTQRLIIKRSKIDVSIILKESDEKSKYELFQRLNTGGSPLSEQEVRNSMLVMINPEMYRWLRELANSEDFRECTALTDRAIVEQYDMDLVLRFVIFRKLPENELRNIGDINEYLTDKMIELVDGNFLDIEEETLAFEKTFAILRSVMGSNSFHRYDSNKDRFVGGFLISAFELLALGIGFHYRSIDSTTTDLVSIMKRLWVTEDFTSRTGSGMRASYRLPNTIPLGRDTFRP